MAWNPNTQQEDPSYTPPTTGIIDSNIPATPPATGQSLTSGLLSVPAPSTPSTSVAPAKWEVTPDQTVSGQVNKIIAEDSPLMQQATASGMQTANNRGLLNSTMAIGAAQDAVYRAATPIATADAATHAQAAATNAGFGQQFGVMDKQQGYDLAKMDKQAAITLGQMDVEQKNTLEKYAVAQGYNLETMSAQQINELAKASVLQGYNLETMDRTVVNSLKILDAQTVADMEKMAKAQGYSLDTASAQLINDLAKASVLNGYEVAKGLADRETQLQVNQLLTDNKLLVDTNVTAQKALSDYSTALTSINNNKDLSRTIDQATGKSPYQNAIDDAAQNLSNSLTVIGEISGIDLSGLFDYGDAVEGGKAGGERVGGTNTADETANAIPTDLEARQAAWDAAPEIRNRFGVLSDTRNVNGVIVKRPTS